MDKNVKAFIIYMASLTLKMSINLAWKAQIALFIAKKIIITVVMPRSRDLQLSGLPMQLFIFVSIQIFQT